MTHVANDRGEDIFESWPTDFVSSLGELDCLSDLTDRTRAVFASAARAADREVKDHISQRNSMQHSSRWTGKSGKGRGKGGKRSVAATNKDYERELGASVETLRHLQRLKVVSSSQPKETASLVKLPLQLGFCSAREFQNSNDDCKSRSKKRLLPDFLTRACSVGLISWKVRHRHGTCLTPTFRRRDVSSHFVHAFKEGALQRFFRGSVVVDGWAEIPPPSPHDDVELSGKGSIVFLEDVKGSMADNLRHHIGFIV